MTAEEYIKAHTIGSMHIQGFYVMSKDAEKALEIKEREHQNKLKELYTKIEARLAGDDGVSFSAYSDVTDILENEINKG